MDRRTFISAIAFGTLADAPIVGAQERIRQIGHLSESSQPIPPRMEALRDLGWVVGRNITLILRGSDQADQLKDLAADLVRQKCDLIITSGSGATLAAKQATSSIPIVFGVGGDPVARGLVGSMSRPGGNLTGFALGIYDDKQLQVLKSALPAVSRVAYAHIEGSSFSSWVNLEAARALGVQLQPVTVGLQQLDDFALFFAAAKHAGAEAALIPDVARLNSRLRNIGMEASKSRVPAIGYRRWFAEGGGLLSYSPLQSEVEARIAMQVNRILRGANPGDLPVEQPTRFEFVINLREAKALGVSIPRVVRLSADELIQ
jgi:ABC-type uncharacterized transport system substrate-binding protein